MAPIRRTVAYLQQMSDDFKMPPKWYSAFERKLYALWRGKMVWLYILLLIGGMWLSFDEVARRGIDDSGPWEEPY